MGCKRLPESPKQSMPQQAQQQMHRPKQPKMMTNSTTPPAMATMNLQTGQDHLVRHIYGWRNIQLYILHHIFTFICAHTHTQCMIHAECI